MRSTIMCLALIALLSTTGCASSSVGTDCAWARPILVSAKDVLTDVTARQILAHNLKVADICGAGRKPEARKP